MTAKEVQAKSLELARGFDRLKFKFVEAKPGDKVEFEFRYKGEFDIYGVVRSCGCVADFDIVKEGDLTLIKGKYDVGNGFSKEGEQFKDVMQSFTVYFVDGEDYNIVKNSVIVVNPNKPKVNLVLDGQVKVY